MLLVQEHRGSETEFMGPHSQANIVIGIGAVLPHGSGKCVGNKKVRLLGMPPKINRLHVDVRYTEVSGIQIQTGELQPQIGEGNRHHTTVVGPQNLEIRDPARKGHYYENVQSPFSIHALAFIPLDLVSSIVGEEDSGISPLGRLRSCQEAEIPQQVVSGVLGLGHFYLQR